LDHGDIMHDIGHGFVPHLRDSRKAPQLLPPYREYFLTFCILDLTPPPHFLEQADQAPQPEVAQLMGHGRMLHFTISVNFPHFLPPPLGPWMTRRVRVFSPAPHFREHEPQGAHIETLQF
jgi:hypothetical protein